MPRIEVFDGFRQAVITEPCTQFMKYLAIVFFGADRPGANIPEALETGKNRGLDWIASVSLSMEGCQRDMRRDN